MSAIGSRKLFNAVKELFDLIDAYGGSAQQAQNIGYALTACRTRLTNAREGVHVLPNVWYR